jgi:hypothetical protein
VVPNGTLNPRRLCAVPSDWRDRRNRAAHVLCTSSWRRVIAGSRRRGHIPALRIKEPASRELLESARQIKDMRARASELERDSAEQARKYAHWLVAQGVPVRDIAALVGDIAATRQPTDELLGGVMAWPRALRRGLLDPGPAGPRWA